MTSRPSLVLGRAFSAHQTGRKETRLLYGSILGHSEDEMLAKLDEIIEFSVNSERFHRRTRLQDLFCRHEGRSSGWRWLRPFKPHILLIDEVLGVGDPNFGEKSKEENIWPWSRVRAPW